LEAGPAGPGGAPMRPEGPPREELPPGAIDPGTTLARRLTIDEYAHTVRDVLGVALTADDLALLPRDTSVDGFRNTAVGLVVSVDHVDAWWLVAERVSERLDVTAFATARAGCAEAGAECEASFVRGAGDALFRRPLDEREVARFTPLFEAARAESLGFDDGARLVLVAMLQAPAFLYRLETQRTGTEGVRAVSGHELAARLSYLVWASAPDDALRRDAAEGRLDTAEGIDAALDRMLADERATRSTDLFVRDWMQLHRLDGISREDLDAAQARELVDAAVRTYQDHVWDAGLPLAGVLDGETAFLTPDIAAWYGLPSAGPGLARYDLAPVPERIGLLTHPGVLTVMSDRDVGGIVARGLFVMEHVLCAEPLEPPPDLDLSSFRSHLGPEATDREYSEDRIANASCGGCHVQFDPFAYALERFDGIGRHQLTSEHGRALREDGALPVRGAEAEPFANVDEYARLLAADPRVQRCVTEKHLQYALGRAIERADEHAVDAVHDTAAREGGTYEATIRAIATHEIFRALRTEE
ncbi:MAG: DUF1592 domain-containing protein, partial [Myxococcota bacterium]|nr:DUF1592 domain-containing protein [Myxococcota bacterium]